MEPYSSILFTQHQDKTKVLKIRHKWLGGRKNFLNSKNLFNCVKKVSFHFWKFEKKINNEFFRIKKKHRADLRSTNSWPLEVSKKIFSSPWFHKIYRIFQNFLLCWQCLINQISENQTQLTWKACEPLDWGRRMVRGRILGTFGRDPAFDSINNQRIFPGGRERFSEICKVEKYSFV